VGVGVLAGEERGELARIAGGTGRCHSGTTVPTHPDVTDASSSRENQKKPYGGNVTE